jgi:hypothetical protein
MAKPFTLPIGAITAFVFLTSILKKKPWKLLAMVLKKSALREISPFIHQANGCSWETKPATRLRFTKLALMGPFLSRKFFKIYLIQSAYDSGFSKD